jgi:hydroxymethylpyrimidine kinase/phosphomethylpyrimidine kinase
MRKHRTQPITLTIAGSDSGGGAGIQADLKVFQALGVHGTSAITCVTAQNPKGVRAIQQLSPAMVRAQLQAVFAELPPTAAKTGMLHSAQLIEVVAETFRLRTCPLVVDPVMIATSGAKLIYPKAIAVLRKQLLPLATLVTPNINEAEVLVGRSIRSPEQMRSAARQIVHDFGCAALVKGGHLATGNSVLDIFYDGNSELLLEAPRMKGIRPHGTGCTYSAAIAACLAKGESLIDAVQIGKEFITHCLATGYYAGKHFVLNTCAE